MLISKMTFLFNVKNIPYMPVESLSVTGYYVQHHIFLNVA